MSIYKRGKMLKGLLDFKAYLQFLSPSEQIDEINSRIEQCTNSNLLHTTRAHTKKHNAMLEKLKKMKQEIILKQQLYFNPLLFTQNAIQNFLH